MRTQHPRKGHSSPHFSAHICRGQMAGCTKTPLGMEVDLSPGDFVRWGPSPPSPKRGRTPNFAAHCLLWPNGWMDQVTTWYGGRSRLTRHCVRRRPNSPTERGTAGQQRLTFRPMSIVVKTAEVLFPHNLVKRQPIFNFFHYRISKKCSICILLQKCYYTTF